MTHLRHFLEDHGVLYPEQLAEALRRQQIYGGSLDTVLLELEFIDPSTLGDMLERACGFPIVPPELLENGLVRPWADIPDDMQRSRWVEPLAKDGTEVVVAVHPDLPDDLLGKLLRSVKRLRPMVTPECCLEKVAAERHQSVVPQRYAVLCAAYLSAIRRRPSVSGIYDVPHDAPPSLGDGALGGSPDPLLAATAGSASVGATTNELAGPPASLSPAAATDPLLAATDPLLAATAGSASVGTTTNELAGPPASLSPAAATDPLLAATSASASVTNATDALADTQPPVDRRSVAGSIEVDDLAPMSLPDSMDRTQPAFFLPPQLLDEVAAASMAPDEGADPNARTMIDTGPPVTPSGTLISTDPAQNSAADDAETDFSDVGTADTAEADAKAKAWESAGKTEVAFPSPEEIAREAEALRSAGKTETAIPAVTDEPAPSEDETNADELDEVAAATRAEAQARAERERASNDPEDVYRPSTKPTIEIPRASLEAELATKTASATTEVPALESESESEPDRHPLADTMDIPEMPADAKPVRDEADIRRRLEQAFAVLDAARSRDEALDAIVDAAMIVSTRVGLFRARKDELVGLSTHRSALGDIGGKIVGAPEGSAAAIALANGRFHGPAMDTDLRLATGTDATTPCVLQRVEVRGRAVVVVYLDRDGVALDENDLEWLDGITTRAGGVFEEILKLRRQAAPAPESKPKSKPEPETTAEPPRADAPTPAEPEKSWGPASDPVQAAYGDGAADHPVEPPTVEPTETSRASTPQLEHPESEGPPPAIVPPDREPEPHGDWRLTPELASAALQTESDEPSDDDAPRGSSATVRMGSGAVPTPGTEPDADSDAPPIKGNRTAILGSATDVRPPDESASAVETTESAEATEATDASADEATDSAESSNAAESEEDPAEATDEAEQVDSTASQSVEATISMPAVRDPNDPEAPAEDDGAPTQHSVPTHIATDAPEPAEPEAAASSSRPTMELSRLGDGEDDILTRDTQELTSGPAPALDDERAALAARATVHLSPPPPPLPPPPPSAVEDEQELQAPATEDAATSGSRRARSPTIHGLPPPELSSDSGSRRVVPKDDDEQDVTIIPLAQPIMPATARGRIELEDEDWMGGENKVLASDSQQGAIDDVIDAVVTGEATIEQLRELGTPALLRLVAQFPGPLEVLRRDLRSLPPPSAHGPLIRTVIAVGSDIVPHLIDLLEHPNSDVRFYAAFVFHELRDPRCMRPLALLAFDPNGDVRVVSMRVLETYRRAEGFSDASAIVRDKLRTEGRSQQLNAARAAGTLRDTGGIPELIELLSSRDRFIQEAALESLCSITGQQHGLKPHRWRNWYQEHGDRHRVEWIIDSLRHRNLPVRRWAADELVRITGHRVPFSPMGDRRARDVAAKAWSDWWNDRGRTMFGG